jgi:Druantia protein DruA
MSRQWCEIPVPRTWPERSRRTLRTFARSISNGDAGTTAARRIKRVALGARDPHLKAAACVLNDLVRQGWDLSVGAKGALALATPEVEADPAAEKARVRRQELLKRDEQLSSPSVRSFVSDMEKPREFGGGFVSIFSLMRDGHDLAERLKALVSEPSAGAGLRTIIDPYVQVIRKGDRCAHTGLRLTDVWRYFRHTWSNQYTTTPGRTMLILVRDRAAAFHPVIGIAALASPIVQIAERDEWIGWQPGAFLTRLAETPTLSMARWIADRLTRELDELHLDDLIEDGLYWPSLWDEPTSEAVDRLVKEASARRRDHHRFVRRAEMKIAIGGDSWRDRAESDLFRSKRCLALAELLRLRVALTPLLDPKPTVRGLKRCLETATGRRAIASVLRRAKAEAVGTEIADLTVCGAIPPYSALLGGKLVGMLAVSPTVVRAYHERYGGSPSEIASALAGRAVSRRSHLVFVGTTSLYGSGSSQYNRLRIPAAVLDGDRDVFFRALGRSRSFGTSHLSNEAVTALVQLSEQSRTGVRVNSIFGEGVNPKLRKVRDGLRLLGWPEDDLMRHGRERIVYGVSLVDNLLPYLLGLEKRPRYVFPRKIRNDIERIGNWWHKRWLAERIKSIEVLEMVAVHSIHRPVRHGARVQLPREMENG